MALPPSSVAISPPVEPLTGLTTTTQSSDLPLRNYSFSPGPSVQVDSHSGPSLRSMSDLSSAPPETPNSVTAEYGEAGDPTPAAVIIARTIFETYRRSQPRSCAPGGGHRQARGTVHTKTPESNNSPREGSPGPRQRKDLDPVTEALNDKVHKFLGSMGPPNTWEDLAKENRSLHQRLAALQRIEHDLLNDNQELSRRLASVQKRHETRRHQWKEELLSREAVFEARIKDLESRLVRQEEELVRLSLDRPREATLSDSAISAWLATKAHTWRDWAGDFAHRDPNRVSSGLHPVQRSELCEAVKHFVRLSDERQLPEELSTSSAADNAGIHPVRLLLHGMLANFIVKETLASPFWVFEVIAPNALELESPVMSRFNPKSPAGFRMDLANWNRSIAPPRDAHMQPFRPAPPTSQRLAESRDRRKLPRLVTSIQSPSVSSGPGMAPLDQNLPSRQSMEEFSRVLASAQGANNNPNSWRASLMKAFCDGGMSTEVDSILLSNDARLLAEARVRYAVRLKDVFLRSPARFLLQDQDAAGIERLEYRLTQEIDAALRFSCRLWCHHDTPGLKGLREFADTNFCSSSTEMGLCQAQASRAFSAATISPRARDAPPGYYDGHPIIMVIQPSIGVGMGRRNGKESKGSSTRIWSKASMLVRAPKLVRDMEPSAATPYPTSPATASVQAKIGSPATATAPPMPPPAEPKSALGLLPSTTFVAVSRPSLE